MYELDKYKAKPTKTIAEHTMDLISQLELMMAYGYIKDKRIYKLSRKACELHDIGKMNAKFQVRLDSKKKIKFDSLKEVPHNILSGCMIDKNEFEDKEDYLLVLHAASKKVCRHIFDISSVNGPTSIFIFCTLFKFFSSSI